MKLGELLDKLAVEYEKHGDCEVTISDGYQGRFYAGDFCVGGFLDDNRQMTVDIGIGGCDE